MNCVAALSSHLCSQGKFLPSWKLPQQWAECSGPWEMAQGLEVTAVPGENQSLCASEAVAPMLCPLALRRGKAHNCFQLHFLGSGSFCRNTLLAFTPSSCKYLSNSRNDFEYI